MRVHVAHSGNDPLQTIPARIENLCTSQGASVAVRFGSQQMTYAELVDRMILVGQALKRSGCRQGDRVALLAENNLEFIAAFLGIVRFGACAVTLPTMLPAENLAVLLGDSKATILIASRQCKELAADTLKAHDASAIFRFGLDFEEDVWPRLWQPPGSEPAGHATSGNIDPQAEFNIVYSSGTTGIPKGILHSHATRATLAAGFAGLGFDSSATTLISTPLYTNMSIPAFLGTLWGGGTVEVMEKFDPRRYLELASGVRATHFFLVPTQVTRLQAEPEFKQFDLTSTRLKYVAGSKLPARMKTWLIEDWPGKFVEVYGMSEGAPFTVLFGSQHRDKLDSVGYAPPGASIQIIDDNDRIVPVGQVGEIVGCSGSMMLGYNNRPVETSALIWRHPDGTAYFRSGDIGRIDADGYLYIVDRKKDIIISGGYNIYSSDLEDVFIAHPDVQEAAVIGIESARWGESPVAFVVLKEGATMSPDSLRSWANERLGKYQRVLAVELRTELPRNALGKVLKRSLKDEYRPIA